MKIEKMTTAMLRAALEERGLPTGGGKCDLESRLRQDLQDKGQDPELFDYQEPPPSETPTDMVSTIIAQISAQLTAQSEKLSEKLEAQSEKFSEKLEAQSEKFSEKLEAQSEKLEAQSEKFSEIKDELFSLNNKMSENYTKLDSKVRSLESDVIDMVDSLTQLQTNVDTKLAEVTENTKELLETKIYDIESKFKNEIQKIENKIAVPGKPITDFVSQGSQPVAFPVDPKVIKDSLPEFHGRLEECPITFLTTCESLLKRTCIPQEIYLQVISQQLRGSAGTWWQNIKGLSLDWESFKQEFLQRFNSEAVKASITKKFLTEVQPSGMRAGAFVIQKLQLFRRINNGGSINDSVPYIMELLHDKVRSLVKVAQPKTFDELRNIVTKLDEETSFHSSKTKVPVSNEPMKCYKCGLTGHVRARCPEKLDRDRSNRGGEGSGRMIRPQGDQSWLKRYGIGQILAEGGVDHPRPAITLRIGNNHYTAALDTQASHSFVSMNVAKFLRPVRPDKVTFVKGAVQEINYKIEGFTFLEAKCSEELIFIPVKVVKDLLPNIILGHDFLEKYGVVIDYTANEIFFGNKNRVRVGWVENKNLKIEPILESNVLTELKTGPLNANQKKELVKLLSTFPEVITDTVGFTTTVKHQIVCKDNTPVKQKPYPLNPDKRKFIIEKVKEMESQGFIEPSSSGWASPIVLPKKKNGEYRLCVDLRQVNSKTISDAYPMPDLRNIIKQVNGAKLFSSLDLNSGYWQVEVEESSRPMTAFSTPRGLYQFRVMPFGLKNAPATFMRLMDKVLSGYTGEFCQVYLDDILVYSKTFSEHLEHLARILERLKIHGLTCQMKKCQFASTSVEYLGHVLTDKGLERQTEKNKAIEEYGRPRTKRQVRQFLGLCGWYSSFVPHFETKASPLTDLLSNDKPFKWTEKEELAFKEIKRAICESPGLAYLDSTREICLQTDASDVGLGAVLFHERADGGKDIVEYASRKLSPTEKNYCTAEKEALAVIWAVGKFRGYLEGRKFKLFTDNSSLQWLNKVSGTKSKLMRWALILADFDFDIHHVPGKLNQAADSLSRNPADGCKLNNELLEREIPVLERKTQRGPVLLTIRQGNADIDLELIRKWQTEDTACSRMKAWISKRSTDSRTVPIQFKACYKHFRLEDDVLMYKSHLPGSSPVVVIPRSQSVRILEKYHDSSEAGHPGQEETYTSIRRRFFWLHMHRDIKNYVQSCTICACTKANNQKASTSMRGRRPHQPWEILALDLMGPYPRTSRGKTGILVVTDLFTRWVEAFAIPEATSGRILQILRTEVFSRYGYPRCLLTDNGSQFTSRQWLQTLAEWGIEHWTTPIYHPQANPTERRNQELKKMFRIHLFDKDHTKWDQHLHESLLAIRQRVNRVTGFSPAELFLGRPIKRTGDWNIVRGREGEPVDPTAWNDINQRQIQRMNRQAETRSRREAEKNDMPEETDFRPGTLVLRRNHPQSNKLQKFHAGMARKWLGPFEVERKLGNGVYLLKSDPPIKVHASELKKLPQTLRENDEAEEEDQQRIPTSQAGDEAGESHEDQRTPILLDDQQDEDSFRPRYNLRPRLDRNVQSRY